MSWPDVTVVDACGGRRPGAARMFAPAIGVDEDVANANSTGCPAAHLLDTTGAQTVAIEVEQGDTLGRPASVLASRPTRAGGHHDPVLGMISSQASNSVPST